MKIQIIGFSGSGKSTLAKMLSEKLSLPVLYLDTVFWLPGWKMRPREEQTETLEAFLNKNDQIGWVIDGNYSKNLFDRRMEEADTLLFLNFSRLRCLYRILKRNIMYQGKSRFSMTEGCDEKIDWEFIRWSMWDSRTKAAGQNREAIKDRFPDKFVEITNPKELQKYLSRISR